MIAGREFDLLIGKEVMGHELPLKPYSTSIEAAFEVAAKLGVTLIPIEGGQWFAFIGPNPGWKSPGEFLQFLSQADFTKSGAAVHESAPYSICVAAWNAVQQRQLTQSASELAARVAGSNTGVTH